MKKTVTLILIVLTVLVLSLTGCGVENKKFVYDSVTVSAEKQTILGAILETTKSAQEKVYEGTYYAFEKNGKVILGNGDSTSEGTYVQDDETVVVTNGMGSAITFTYAKDTLTYSYEVSDVTVTVTYVKSK